jgi:transposase-like protein
MPGFSAAAERRRQSAHAMLRAGTSRAEIAKQLGCTQETLRRDLLLRDVPKAERASKLKDEEPQPDDERVRYWTKKQMVEMDILFCMRMRRAIARELERAVEIKPMRRAG